MLLHMVTDLPKALAPLIATGRYQFFPYPAKVTIMSLGKTMTSKFTAALPLLLAILMGASSAAALAEDTKQNPFTLVYKGAIEENVEGKVNIHPVTYELNGIEIAATPANYDPSKRYPALVVAHPNGGVKEQVAGLYAQRLAEQGYITIAADAAYQGASGGTPRNVDKPANRIEDLHGMADFITQFEGVNALD